MILEVDMGNTRIKWRVRQASEILAQGAIATQAAPECLESELSSYVSQIVRVWVVSVVGAAIERRFEAWAQRYLAASTHYARSQAFNAGVTNGYREFERLGADRWLSIVSAYRLTGGACVVVSLGTAATVDLIDADGCHLGGYIAPGLRTMIGSLSTSARALELANPPLAPNLSPGGSTELAVGAGCTSMLVGLVNNAIEQLAQLTGGDNYQLLITGGDGDHLAEIYPGALIVPDLVLRGLEYVMQD